MPLYRRLPKGGFTNIFRKKYRIVNIDQLQRAVEAGKLDAGETVTEDGLVASGVIKSKRDGVRILAEGEIKTVLQIEVSGASRAAIEAIEKVGGKITLSAAVKKKKRNQTSSKKG